MHVLVAAYLGFKPEAQREQERDEKLLTLMNSLPVDTSAPALNDSAWQAHVAKHGDMPNG